MYQSNVRAKWGKAAFACALSTVLAFQAPGIAFCATKEELQQEMQTAQSTLATLNSEAELAQYDLINVELQLSETNGRIAELDEQIPQTEAELKESQSELGAIVADSYKAGVPSLLEVILGSTSFEDLVSRIEYANKVAQYKGDVIAQVKDLSNRLNQQKSELEVEKANKEQLVEQQQERVAAAESAAASAQAYYDGLSGELQEMIAAEEAAARAAAEEDAREAAAEAQRVADERASVEAQQTSEPAEQSAENQGPESNGQQSQGDEQSANDSEREAQQDSLEQSSPSPSGSAASASNNSSSGSANSGTSGNASSGSSSSGSGSSSSGGSSSSSSSSSNVSVTPSASVSAFVARAYSIIGAGYQWSGYTWSGSVYGSAFTCSGVVDFARGMPSRSSSPESLYAEVGSRLVYSTSQLNYGDLVFYSYAGRYPGHVGIYVGGGQIIDSIPSGGVAIRNVNYMNFIGGGPIY